MREEGKGQTLDEMITLQAVVMWRKREMEMEDEG